MDVSTKLEKFDDFKGCWLYLQEIPKFGEYAMKHHESKVKGKRKSSDGEDFEANAGGSDSDKGKENVRPIGTKKARRLREEEDFIERTASALGKHLDN